MELLNCGRNKAIKSMRELDDETGIGLIEKRRQGIWKGERHLREKPLCLRKQMRKNLKRN